MKHFPIRWIPILPVLLLAMMHFSAVAEPLANEPLASPDRCETRSLCARLGGPQALREIAAALVERTAHDPRTAARWERVDLQRVKRKLGEYLCVLTGGTCNYENDDLHTIHAGLHIHSGEFYALVEMLRSELDGRAIAAQEKNELLGLLASSKRDVVQP